MTRRERELAEEILGETPGRLAEVGLPACLAAVNESAVAHLLVAHEGMMPGFACGRCGALSTDSDECPDWGTAAPGGAGTCWRRWCSRPPTATGR